MKILQPAVSLFQKKNTGYTKSPAESFSFRRSFLFFCLSVPINFLQEIYFLEDAELLATVDAALLAAVDAALLAAVDAALLAAVDAALLEGAV
jgi:hypothetical protein